MPLGLDPWATQPVASHYTNYTLPALVQQCSTMFSFQIAAMPKKKYSQNLTINQLICILFKCIYPEYVTKMSTHFTVFCGVTSGILFDILGECAASIFRIKVGEEGEHDWL